MKNGTGIRTEVGEKLLLQIVENNFIFLETLEDSLKKGLCRYHDTYREP